MAVVMRHGETVIFSLQATDNAGNTATAISPPLTIDTTPPLISSLSCNKYLSKARSHLSCAWETAIDEESPLDWVRIGLGTEQRTDDVLTFYGVRLTERTWSATIPDRVFDAAAAAVNESTTSVWVSLLVENRVEEMSGEYVQVIAIYT